jgi:hypothetical protein
MFSSTWRYFKWLVVPGWVMNNWRVPQEIKLSGEKAKSNQGNLAKMSLLELFVDVDVFRKILKRYGFTTLFFKSPLEHYYPFEGRLRRGFSKNEFSHQNSMGYRCPHCLGLASHLPN